MRHFELLNVRECIERGGISPLQVKKRLVTLYTHELIHLYQLTRVSNELTKSLNLWSYLINHSRTVNEHESTFRIQK